MKNDLMTTVLNFVLAALVLLSVIFTLLIVRFEPKIPQIANIAVQANGKMMQINALLNETAAYNAKAHSPELARILAANQQKPATR